MPNTRLKNNQQQAKQVMYHLPGLLMISCRLVILSISILWWLADNYVWFWVAVVAYCLTLAPQLLIKNRTLSIATKACVSSLLCAHILLGMHLGLYESSAIYDKIMHVLGTGLVAGLVLLAVIQYSHRLQLYLPQPLLLLLVLGITISAGTLWEVFEFAMDRTGWFYAQRGLHDTMFDLIADAIGAVTTLALYVGVKRRNGFGL